MKFYTVERDVQLPGIHILTPRRFDDDRGYFLELFRADMDDFLDGDTIVQSNCSMTFPGIVRAWHRHTRGQNDYFAVVRGVLKICAYDDRPDSPTRGRLFETVVHASGPRIVRIPGHYWHGIMALGVEPAVLIYFVTRMYDPANPDEDRRPWNDPDIIDPRSGQPYDWFRPPHR